jgi:hypothetical protein
MSRERVTTCEVSLHAHLTTTLKRLPCAIMCMRRVYVCISSQLARFDSQRCACPMVQRMQCLFRSRQRLPPDAESVQLEAHTDLWQCHELSFVHLCTSTEPKGCSCTCAKCATTVPTKDAHNWHKLTHHIPTLPPGQAVTTHHVPHQPASHWWRGHFHGRTPPALPLHPHMLLTLT